MEVASSNKGKSRPNETFSIVEKGTIVLNADDRFYNSDLNPCSDILFLKAHGSRDCQYTRLRQQLIFFSLLPLKY